VVDSVLVKRRERLSWHERVYCKARKHQQHRQATMVQKV
jgi:hypothetical protein